MTNWHVYIIESVSRLYTGISTDPQQRLAAHNGERPGGAKATRAGRPWKLVHTEPFETKSAALRREAAIKKLKRAEKLVLVNQ